MKKKNEKDSQNTKTTPTPLYTVALYEISKKRKEVKELELLLFNRYHRMKKGADENDINVCLY